jgi:hypothetical protein
MTLTVFTRLKRYEEQRFNGCPWYDFQAIRIVELSNQGQIQLLNLLPPPFIECEKNIFYISNGSIHLGINYSVSNETK